MSVDYAPRSLEQEARFVAFVAECEERIKAAGGHEHVVSFLRTLDLDAMRALYKLAKTADAGSLVVLIALVSREKGWTE